MTLKERLLRAVSGNDGLLLPSRDTTVFPLFVERDGDDGLTLSQETGDDEPRSPDEPDMVIIARDQARALIPILQAFVGEQ